MELLKSNNQKVLERRKLILSAEVSKEEVCSSANFATLQNSKTPVLNDRLFNDLPEILKSGCAYFKNKNQRDLFLTGALGVISGCISNVSGDYHHGEIFANLYTFITAPAANGKGALNYAGKLGRDYHHHVKKSLVEGEQKKSLFIPGNTSASALISQLDKNEGTGIFFETEADTLSNTFKQEWGNFSDLLRKSFHNEPVSLLRKGNNEHLEIELPKLAVVLSGTPNQITRLIPSAEDGLFSRFIFYYFETEPRWEDVTPNKVLESGNKYFSKIASTLSSQLIKTEQLNNIKFKLSTAQFNRLNIVQEKSQQKAIDRFGNDIASVVKRQGVIWFKISMILTYLRKQHLLNPDNLIIECDDIDFNIAESLIKSYTQHSLYVYEKIDSSKPAITGYEKVNEFFNLLPSTEFKRSDALSLIEKIGVKERSIDTYIRELRDKCKLKQTSYGCFIKI